MADVVDDMIRKAEEEKSKEQRKQKQKEEAQRKKLETADVSVERTRPDSERLAVYKAMNLKRVGGLWFLGFTLSVFFLISSLFGDFFSAYDRPFAIGLIAVFTLYYLYTRFWIYVTFPQFKRWRSRLPFVLNGWEQLVDHPSFKYGLSWRHCRIRFELNRDDQETDRAISAAVYLWGKFISDKYYYDATINSPQRRPWTYDALSKTISGSANNDVVAGLYSFIRKPLAQIAVKCGTITKVIIDAEEDDFTVEVESDIGM
jgi:hypothetical protein